MDTLFLPKMKLKRKYVLTVLPEHHEFFTRLLGKKRPWLAPPIPFFKEKTSSKYSFPIRINFLLVGALSILGGLCC